MEEFKDITYTGLIDMLAEYTTRYLKMMSEGSVRGEVDTCKEDIDKIVEEIKSRHQAQILKEKDHSL